MCRTCRYIDPDHSSVFIGSPPSTQPVAAGRRLARPPLPAIRDLDRAPPPLQTLSRHPPSAWPAPPAPAPPPSDRPAQRWASRCGGGGAPGHPRHGISSAKNGSADFGGLKIDPPKSMSLQFLHQRVRRLFLGRYWKKSRRSNKYFERYSQKTWGEGRICPPPFPVRVLKVFLLLFKELFAYWARVMSLAPSCFSRQDASKHRYIWRSWKINLKF